MNFSTKGLWQNRRYNKGNIKIMMAFWQFFCYRIRLQGCSQFLVLHDFCRSYINSAIFWLWHKSISSRLLSPVPYIFSLSVTNNTFYIFGGSIVADYSKDRVEGETPYIWGRGWCVLAIAKIFLVLVMGLVVCWSTSRYLKGKFLALAMRLVVCWRCSVR